jgi:hypothetical protein
VGRHSTCRQMMVCVCVCTTAGQPVLLPDEHVVIKSCYDALHRSKASLRTSHPAPCFSGFALLLQPNTRNAIADRVFASAVDVFVVTGLSRKPAPLGTSTNRQQQHRSRKEPCRAHFCAARRRHLVKQQVITAPVLSGGPQTGGSSGQQQQEQPSHTLRQFSQLGG